ncbi:MULTISPECIES: DUF4946 domain-containing protein [unclassified Rhizobium]|uniref:DUF4946 domain-containing protein n=1 Tax=unclassified Rhizobium TaxID=2613769 RepID=UPI0011C35DAC|nr:MULTISPECIES: DUF4946 domain-containing protein [unclassified Rhizobium]
MNIEVKTMSMRVFSVIAMMAFLPIAPAAAASSVTWPQGWELRQSPVPTSNSGEKFDGSNQLAVKVDKQGQMLAVLNLIVLTIKEGDKPTLESQTASLANTMRAGYAEKGMTSLCQQPEDTTLGGFPARQMRCSVLKDKTDVLEQLLIVTIGRHTVQALSLTTSPASFETYEPDFVATRDSLRID